MPVPDRTALPKDVTLDTFMDALWDNFARALTVEDPWPEQAATTSGNPINLGPRIPDPTTWTQDMVSGVQANGAKWLRNTLAPKKDPKAAALASAPKYNSAMQEVISQGRYAAGVSTYDQEQAVTTIQTIGQQGYITGVTARTGKIQAKITRLHQLLAAQVNALDRMPEATDQDRKNKMLANYDGMKAIGLAMKGIAAAAGMRR